MNLLRGTKLVSTLPNIFRTQKKKHHSRKNLTHEIFENEKCLDKFEDLQKNKIIYKKDHKDYLKLYERYRPEYAKLTVERSNPFNFLIYWKLTEESSVCISNGAGRKVKNFTQTLWKLKEELAKLSVPLEGSQPNEPPIRRVKEDGEVEGASPKVPLKNISNGGEQQEGHVQRSPEKTSPSGSASPQSNQKGTKKKNSYTKLHKIWECFLSHKERNNVKEERTCLEILRRNFLKAQFFGENKKKDFLFFEHILTSLLLRPHIFISVLNSLHCVFFDRRVGVSPGVAPISSGGSAHSSGGSARGDGAPPEQDNGRQREPHGDTPSSETSAQMRRYILNYLFNIYYEKHVGLQNMQRTFDLHQAYKLRYWKKEKTDYKFIASSEVELESNNIILIKCAQTSDSFLVGVVNKVQRARDFSVLFMNVRRYICGNKRGGDVAKLYEEMEMSEEYVESYLNRRSGAAQEFSVAAAHMDSARRGDTAISSIYGEHINHNPSRGDPPQQPPHTDDPNVHEAVTLAVHLNTISNRIKYSMLSLFGGRKDPPHSDLLQLLLNEEKNPPSVVDPPEVTNMCSGTHHDGKFNFLIQEAIHKFLENRKKEIHFFDVVNKDLIKSDKVVGKLHKRLRNSPEEFARMCSVYRRFDVYQKGVLQDILINEGGAPVHLVRGAPGSGKSDLISFIIYFLTLERKNNIFVGTSKHISVQNVRQKLMHLNLCLNRDTMQRPTNQKSDIFIDTIYQAFKIKDKKIKHLIIDEASSLSEYSSLICLNLNCDFVYAFGDDKQLTFHSLINERKRLQINYLSIFEKLSRYRKAKCHTLLIQYRLIFPMYLFTSFYFYERKLIASKKIMDSFFRPGGGPSGFIGPEVDNHPEREDVKEDHPKREDIGEDPPKVNTAWDDDPPVNLTWKSLFQHCRVPILFIDTYHAECNAQTLEVKINYSYVNQFEAQVIMKLVQMLNLENQKNVTILTPYTSQKLYIQSMLRNGYLGSRTHPNDPTPYRDEKENKETCTSVMYQKVAAKSGGTFFRGEGYATPRGGSNSSAHRSHDHMFELFKKGNIGGSTTRLSGTSREENILRVGLPGNSYGEGAFQADHPSGAPLFGNILSKRFPPNGEITGAKNFPPPEKILSTVSQLPPNGRTISRIDKWNNRSHSNRQPEKVNPQVDPNVNTLQRNVHTIDSYQGCENDFIIISTVRSNDKNVLGFLNDEKRLNVLLTRMKKGIIIVGNSNTLRNNFFWKEFISFLDFFNSRKSAFTLPFLRSGK
ncbi:unnamed protein product [Plasmodium vivax]|uniref:DNA2/NAM7 helicase-like C-terminal domain-containing protein n=2 Tax=Plasmodium vivax TaxID=5855 RepID=A5K7Y5_PLAVS|nr:hypothetical protein, conserved [Plasmodium vivax]EDL44399.1 hypothetical protein, conserved [Plasmodium vivax]CAG9473365.1 unnamed protein product [Plasmodium vivax]CAI7722015.1 conserved Plasmodium protein, unknown function [Plasmodium vivax]|eukprot:XP_001614126.1 hypothetical protein [Plasmodium vivax Sal-1]